MSRPTAPTKEIDPAILERRAYQARWRAAHPEKVKDYNRQQQTAIAADPERLRQRKEYRKKYRAKNRERLRAYESEYRRTHADQIKEYQRAFYERQRRAAENTPTEGGAADE